MDKVKIVLDIVKKHHFWVLVAVVAVVGVSIYMAAASDLGSKRATRVQTLKSTWTSTETVANEPDPANEGRIANFKKKKEEQEKLVREAWQKLYDQQKAANPWPEMLGTRFLKKIEELGPHKEIPSYPYGEIYSDAIREAAPKLLLTVDYQRFVPIEPEKKDDASKKGAVAPPRPTGRLDGPGGFGQENQKPVGTVKWTTSGLVEQEFKLLPARPSSQQVRLTQENYWVYKALLTIISQTNGDAKTHADAAVKEIVSLQIGQTASAYIGTNKPSISEAGAAAAASGGGMSSGEMGGPPSAMGPGGPGPSELSPSPGGPATASTGSVDDALLNSRYVEYVDGEMRPLMADAVKSGTPFPEFKMMPVVMVLVIDQRKIPDLLVQCANSTMAVEAVQLRVNPGKGSGMEGMGGGGMGGGLLSGGGMAGGAGPGSEMMPGGGPTMPNPGGMGPGGPAPTMPGPGEMGGMGPGGMGMLGANDEEVSPYQVTVEIRAIIYIYNPPPEPTSEVPAGTPAT